MPRFPVSPHWLPNPNIPIHHGPTHERNLSLPPPRNANERICSTCQTSSEDQPIHCLSVSPAPPSYASIAEALPSSRHLRVPVLSVETSQPLPKPQPPRNALQFDSEGRPPIRFRRNAFSPLSPATRSDESNWNQRRSQGLGISNSISRSDASPITPGTLERAENDWANPVTTGAGEEADKDRANSSGPAPNVAQRIEQKLWKYSASRNVIKRWLLEIISWSLSAACMAGIIVVLAIYQNKPIPNWPLGLTFNAFISVLLKIASAGLLLPVSQAIGQLKWSWFNKEHSKKMWDFEIFDNASRGSWGSFLLLLRTKGRALAALGAIVTIFTLALDPIFQQVVEYPVHWKIQPETGSIPRATGYDPYASDAEYRRDTGMMIQTEGNIVGVANKFFYGAGTLGRTFSKAARTEIPLSCPNSNCTWQPYETLGTCSKCADISDLLEFKCQYTTLDWIQVPDRDPETAFNIYPNGTSCGWWLKADVPILMTGQNVDTDTAHSGEILLMRAQPLYDVFFRDPLPGYPAKLNHTRNPLAHVVIVSGENVANIQRNGTPIAHECIVSWCAKEILSEYADGNYKEVVIKTYENSTLGTTPWSVKEYQGVEGNWEGIDYTYLEDVILTTPNKTYRIDNDTHVMTLSLFDDPFPSTYTLANTTDPSKAMLRYRQYTKVNPWMRNVSYNPFMFDNISVHIEDMTTSITNMMRLSTNHSEMITGPSFDLETFVDVRWPWLAFPLGLLTLTFVFLVATIIRSSMEIEHIGIYKTSAIATLLYGLPDDMQEKFRSQVEGTSRANAKEAKVRWVPKTGWRFSGNPDSPVSTKRSSSSSDQ